MLTLLGKELRKLRLENGDLLKDMAKFLSISPAYLSSIEHGNRIPPRAIIEKVRVFYKLDTDDFSVLLDAYHQTVDEVSLDLKNINQGQRDLSLAFARKFDGLSKEDIEKMMTILKKRGDDN